MRDWLAPAAAFLAFLALWQAAVAVFALDVDAMQPDHGADRLFRAPSAGRPGQRLSAQLPARGTAALAAGILRAATASVTDRFVRGLMQIYAFVI